MPPRTTWPPAAPTRYSAEVRTACLNCWAMLTDEEHQTHACPDGTRPTDVRRGPGGGAVSGGCACRCHADGSGEAGR